MSQDTVRIGSVDIQNQAFAEATRVSLLGVIEGCDGLLGLGFDNGTVSGTTPPFYQMLNQKLISRAIFSIYMRPMDSQGGVGEITFGGIKPSRFKGNLVWAPNIHDNGWAIEISKLFLDHKLIDSEPRQAFVDTGAAPIGMPVADEKAVHQALGVTKHWMRGYTFPCADLHKLPDLHLNIDGKNFTLSGHEYFRSIGNRKDCYSLLKGSSLIKDKWVIGLPFLMKYYTVFDLGNKRIGFATAI